MTLSLDNITLAQGTPLRNATVQKFASPDMDNSGLAFNDDDRLRNNFSVSSASPQHDSD